MAYPLTAATSAQQITRGGYQHVDHARDGEEDRHCGGGHRDGDGRLQRPVQHALLTPLGHGPVRVEPFGLGRVGRRGGGRLRIRLSVLPSNQKLVYNG